MKRLALLSPVVALALAAGSCELPPRPLESPPPPAPRPPESRPPASAPPAEAIPPQKVERPSGLLSKPSFSVAMVEKTGDTRTPAAEQAVKAVNLLVMNGYEAHSAQPP